MDALDFIQDRYDWSYRDVERLSDALSDLPMFDFDNIIDLKVQQSNPMGNQ